MEITVKRSLVEMLIDFSWRLLLVSGQANSRKKPGHQSELQSGMGTWDGWRRPHRGRAEPTVQDGEGGRRLLCRCLRWRR